MKQTLPIYKDPMPYTFSSCLCREQHFRTPYYAYWCNEMREEVRFHRKQWEFVYILQSLYERGYINQVYNGRTAIGFGVGQEPIPALLAKAGVEVLATDLNIEDAKDLGWVDSNQHSNGLTDLNKKMICDDYVFQDRVKFMNMDMNNLPQDIGKYDIVWSCCALEHLGSIAKGLDFIKNSARLLKPGGIALHTTEYNISSDTITQDNDRGFVIFRKRDINEVIKDLENEGFKVTPADFFVGGDPMEQYVDLPPYTQNFHIRLQLCNQYTVTSIGLIIQR